MKDEDKKGDPRPVNIRFGLVDLTPRVGESRPNDFPPDVLKACWDRSKGRCECKEIDHRHKGQCNRLLVEDCHRRGEEGCWEGHHRDPKGRPVRSNCVVMCWPCHEKTLGDTGI